MTELMKQFQDETGIDLFGGWSYQVVNGMMTPPLSESPWMKFIQWLCNKLTWRPVSEKPKPGSYFLCNPIGDSNCPRVQFCYSEIGLHGEVGWDELVKMLKITTWLPIPPASEGEVK